MASLLGSAPPPARSRARGREAIAHQDGDHTVGGAGSLSAGVFHRCPHPASLSGAELADGVVWPHRGGNVAKKSIVYGARGMSRPPSRHTLGDSILNDA